MKEDLKKTVEGLKGIASANKDYQDSLLTEGDLKNDSLRVNATIALIQSHLESVEYHLMKVESMMIGLENYISEGVDNE